MKEDPRDILAKAIRLQTVCGFSVASIANASWVSRPTVTSILSEEDPVEKHGTVFVSAVAHAIIELAEDRLGRAKMELCENEDESEEGKGD